MQHKELLDPEKTVQGTETMVQPVKATACHARSRMRVGVSPCFCVSDPAFCRYECSSSQRSHKNILFPATHQETVTEFQTRGLAWPSPSCCGHLESKSANGRPLSLCHPPHM